VEKKNKGGRSRTGNFTETRQTKKKMGRRGEPEPFVLTEKEKKKKKKKLCPKVVPKRGGGDGGGPPGTNKVQVSS